MEVINDGAQSDPEKEILDEAEVEVEQGESEIIDIEKIKKLTGGFTFPPDKILDVPKPGQPEYPDSEGGPEGEDGLENIQQEPVDLGAVSSDSDDYVYQDVVESEEGPPPIVDAAPKLATAPKPITATDVLGSRVEGAADAPKPIDDKNASDASKKKNDADAGDIPDANNVSNASAASVKKEADITNTD